jgi:hypothetical protein
MKTFFLTSVVYILCMQLIAQTAGTSAFTGAVKKQTITDSFQLSEKGFFSVKLQCTKNPPPLNSIHNWVLTVLTADGKPVSDARIQVNGGMPEHGHGFPTQPVVTKQPEEGKYLIEGVKFNMMGLWVMRFNIYGNKKMDATEFKLKVKA